MTLLPYEELLIAESNLQHWLYSIIWICFISDKVCITEFVIFLFIIVRLLWNNLYCIKCCINKGDFTWHIMYEDWGEHVNKKAKPNLEIPKRPYCHPNVYPFLRHNGIRKAERDQALTRSSQVSLEEQMVVISQTWSPCFPLWRPEPSSSSASETSYWEWPRLYCCSIWHLKK